MLREAEQIEYGEDTQSQRLRIMFELFSPIPINPRSTVFQRYVFANNRPLLSPTPEKLMFDFQRAKEESESSGLNPEEAFARSINTNGAVPGGRMFSSHAIVITGYNDQDSTLEFRNSWGRHWKDQGYGYMSYDYFSRFLQSYWHDELPIVAYQRSENGNYHTSGHPLDGQWEMRDGVARAASPRPPLPDVSSSPGGRHLAGREWRVGLTL